MKLTKHWHYLITIIVLFFTSYLLRYYLEEIPSVDFILSASLGVGYIIVIIAWIVFALNKKKNN